jgi:hypothetical protein
MATAEATELELPTTTLPSAMVPMTGKVPISEDELSWEVVAVTPSSTDNSADVRPADIPSRTLISAAEAVMAPAKVAAASSAV